MMDDYKRGRQDCALDNMENAPFSSTGGLDKRDNMQAPDYPGLKYKDAYLRGYKDQAKVLYGDDWQTCKFSWKPVLTINNND